MSHRLRLERRDEAVGIFERVLVELVVHPSTLLAVGHDPGVLQHFEMKGQSRLRRVQCAGEITDAPLSLSEKPDYLEARLV